jgi:hypothetical protein
MERWREGVSEREGKKDRRREGENDGGKGEGVI